MKFALFDTETTGLPYHPQAPLDKQPRIIEFGGIITDGESVLDEISIILNPEVQIEPIITKITGLTNEDLADKPFFFQVVPQIRDFFAQADAVVAHNLSFDKSMVKYDLQRIDQTLADVAWPLIEICSVEQSAEFFGQNMKLQTLYERLVGDYVQKHRALDDVKLMFQVCKKLNIFEAYQCQSLS